MPYSLTTESCEVSGSQRTKRSSKRLSHKPKTVIRTFWDKLLPHPSVPSGTSAWIHIAKIINVPHITKRTADYSSLFLPFGLPFRTIRPLPISPPSISVTHENKTGRENASPPGYPFCRALPAAFLAYSKRQSLTLSPSISLLSLCTPQAPCLSL